MNCLHPRIYPTSDWMYFLNNWVCAEHVHIVFHYSLNNHFHSVFIMSDIKIIWIRFTLPRRKCAILYKESVHSHVCLCTEAGWPRTSVHDYWRMTVLPGSSHSMWAHMCVYMPEPGKDTIQSCQLLSQLTFSHSWTWTTEQKPQTIVPSSTNLLWPSLPFLQHTSSQAASPHPHFWLTQARAKGQNE